jgi:hypothetical protein
MCLTTENNALQCHGLGPVYGSQRGKMQFYIYTTSGKGPHGRGIQAAGGCLISNNTLTIGKWHYVKLEKASRSLSLTVDEDDFSTCQIPQSMTDAQFVMKAPGNCIVAPNSSESGVEVEDFVLAPAIAAAACASPTTAPSATASKSCSDDFPLAASSDSELHSHRSGHIAALHLDGSEAD